jgi:hypothetical protein
MPTFPEPPSELRLVSGQDARIRLGGAGSAGYQWTWSLDGDVDAITVAVEAAPPAAAPPEDSLSSGSLDQIIVVRGARKGFTRLHLSLVRSFQPNRPPLYHYSIDVTVGE